MLQAAELGKGTWIVGKEMRGKENLNVVGLGQIESKPGLCLKPSTLVGVLKVFGPVNNKSKVTVFRT